MSKGTVSIIIPTFNRCGWLLTCLDSLANQTYPAALFEIVVVDDASPDATHQAVTDWINRQKPGLVARLIRLPGQRGPAAARNAGIVAGSGALLAFIDDDCLAEPLWLEQLVTGLSRKQVDGVGGRVRLLTGKGSSLAEAYVQHHRWYEMPKMGDQGPDFLLTGNCLYTRRALEKVGGFDETFAVAAGEDTDLGRRVRAAGFNLTYCPEAVVYHRMHSSLLALLRTGYRYGLGAGYIAVRYPHHRSAGSNRTATASLPPTGSQTAGVFRQFGLALLDKMMSVAARWGSYVGARRAERQGIAVKLPGA